METRRDERRNVSVLTGACLGSGPRDRTPYTDCNWPTRDPLYTKIEKTTAV